jgi:hypothetical protein
VFLALRWKSEGSAHGMDADRIGYMLSRIKSFFTYRSSDWDGHEARMTFIGLGAFICSIGAMATFYGWWQGQGPLWKPLVWAIPVVLLHAITPERRILAGMVLGVFAVYGVRGLILNRDPFGFYVIGVSIFLIFLIVITTPSNWKPR